MLFSRFFLFYILYGVSFCVVIFNVVSPDLCYMLTEAKELKRIGARLKRLRIKKGFKSYESFAVEHELSRMQYWRMEEGKTNMTVRSLIKILNIHKITFEEFFKTGFEN